MPDTKITALTAIGANPIIPSTFPIPMVDLTDTSMAASGTTKKVTVNQILGAGGTATLASATITGDLTVDTSTLKVDSANNRVGIGTASPSYDLEIAGAVRSSLAIRGNFAGGTDIAHLRFINANGSIVGDIYAQNTNGGASDSAYLSFNTASSGTFSERYRIAADGVATWSNVGGVAGTAMTLNATGLGVGVASPLYNIHARGTTNGRIQVEGASGFGMVFIQASSGNAAQLQLNSSGGSGRRFNVYSDSTGLFGISDETAVATRLAIDASGNVISNVTGTAPTLATNSQMVFNLTSNTNLRISVRGTDGTTRTANITLA